MRRPDLAVVTLLTFVASSALGGCVVAGGRSSSTGGGFFFLLLPLLFTVMMLRMVRPARRRRIGRTEEIQPSSAPTVAMLRAELSVLSDDVLRLEPAVALCEPARNDFEAALHRYRVAQTALEQVDEPVDLVRVQRVVDEASWSMARARAILDGRDAPPPPDSLRHTGPRGEPAVGLDDDDRPTYVEADLPFRSGWFGGSSMFFGPMFGFGTWVEEPGDTDELGDRDRRRPPYER